MIETLYLRGYRVFLLDEVHKYPLWSIELKNLYDSYTDIQLLVTASSALNLSHGSADLSRRIDVYTLHAMSFREFLRFEYGHELPVFTFETLLADHEAIYRNYYEQLDLGRKFQRYLKYGAYPFYKEAGHHYHERLLQVVAQVIDVDMPAIFRIDYESSRQVKRLLTLTARLGPFVPNVSKLGRDLAMSRNSILAYLDYLESAALLNILKSGKKSDSALTKPDKILPENTNLVYALGHVDHNKGTLRETYAVNALKVRNTLSTPAKGDLLLDRHYTLEIGGPGKTFHQLADMPNPIIIRDSTELGAPGILPIWMLGLLY
ncbi:MAG: AAA family ATPase [Saprospiraceae bacterium]|nr:AAA family ATPase [Saprospiraceae bacterium]